MEDTNSLPGIDLQNYRSKVQDIQAKIQSIKKALKAVDKKSKKQLQEEIVALETERDCLQEKIISYKELKANESSSVVKISSDLEPSVKSVRKVTEAI
jgi:chromosome segregation ATPase